MFPRAIALTVVFSALAGFVQGAAVLSSPPGASASLDERHRATIVGDVIDRPPLERTFWRPPSSLARPPEPTLRGRIWNPYLIAQPDCTDGLARASQPSSVDSAPC